MLGKMDCFGLTDAGKKRPNNEDQFLIADLSKAMLIHQTSLSHEDHTRLFGGSQGKLLLIADGMGGHAEGKRASSLAVQTMAHYVLNTMHWFFHLEEGREADLHEELKAALEQCQRTIETAAAGNPERARMGTTLTMAYILWPRLYAWFTRVTAAVTCNVGRAWSRSRPTTRSPSAWSRRASSNPVKPRSHGGVMSCGTVSAAARTS